MVENIEEEIHQIISFNHGVHCFCYFSFRLVFIQIFLYIFFFNPKINFNVENKVEFCKYIFK